MLENRVVRNSDLDEPFPFDCIAVLPIKRDRSFAGVRRHHGKSRILRDLFRKRDQGRADAAPLHVFSYGDLPHFYGCRFERLENKTAHKPFAEETSEMRTGAFSLKLFCCPHDAQWIPQDLFAQLK